MKRWHYRTEYGQKIATSDNHPGGDKWHEHPNRGLTGYGKTMGSLMEKR